MRKMIPLSSYARTVSGLTTWPQSTAQTTRLTLTEPSLPTLLLGAWKRTGTITRIFQMLDKSVYTRIIGAYTLMSMR